MLRAHMGDDYLPPDFGIAELSMRNFVVNRLWAELCVLPYIKVFIPSAVLHGDVLKDKLKRNVKPFTVLFDKISLSRCRYIKLIKKLK